MNKSFPHIVVEYRDDIDSHYAESFINEIDEEGLKLDSKVMPSGTMYAAAEWVIPTAIVVCIVKPYFEAFLKEAAKDHYALFKQGLSKLAVKSEKGIKLSVISSGEHKISKNSIFSKSFSLRYIDQERKVGFKFLFRESASDIQVAEASDYFLSIIRDYYENEEDSQLGSMLTSSRRQPSPIIVCYNEITKEAMVLDHRKTLKLEDITSVK